jgi:hypothetical protein
MGRSLPSTRQRQHGAALVMVLMMSTILLIIVTTGVIWALGTQKDTMDTFKVRGQAANVAQAGIQDGLNWFKRQGLVRQTDITTPGTCKDAAFNPVFNTDATLSATDNATVGIVRDYQIKGDLYGRYTLKKQNCASAEDLTAVRDITAAKGKSTTNPPPTFTVGGVTKLRGEGLVWALQSEGILYQRKNFVKTGNVFNLGPSASPNRVLSKSLASVEIAQLSLNIDTAPLTVFATSFTHPFGARCRLVGGTAASAGVYYYGVNPDVSGVQISPSTLTRKLLKSTAVTPDSVFSVSQAELRGMSDNIYTNINQIPDNLKFSITFLEGDFTFTNARPLTGGGLLYVTGNLTLNDNANSLFSGVIFVNGRLTIGKDNSLSGAVLARNVTCAPSAGQAVFEYNSSLVTTVRQRLALYRENNLTYQIKQF